MNLRVNIKDTVQEDKPITLPLRKLTRVTGQPACLAFVFTEKGTEKVLGSLDVILATYSRYPLCHALLITYTVINNVKIKNKSFIIVGKHPDLINVAIVHTFRNYIDYHGPRNNKRQKITRIYRITGEYRNTRIDLATLRTMPSTRLKIFHKIHSDSRFLDSLMPIRVPPIRPARTRGHNFQWGTMR